MSAYMGVLAYLSMKLDATNAHALINELLTAERVKVRAEVLREAADELAAMANPTTERGAGVMWSAEQLRRMADHTKDDEK